MSLELKIKVADNELYATKLMKERKQLQERVASLENLIPSIGKSIFCVIDFVCNVIFVYICIIDR